MPTLARSYERTVAVAALLLWACAIAEPGPEVWEPEQAEEGAPVFLSPLGSGMSFDVSEEPCVELEVELDDVDSLELELSMEEPLVGGSWLDVEARGHRGVWHWCPHSDQLADAAPRRLVLSADDGVHPPVIKSYLVKARQGCQPDSYEFDGDIASARVIDLDVGLFSSVNGTICGDDEDWFRIDLNASQTVDLDLIFEQFSPAEDLDLLLFTASGTPITRCSEDDPAGCREDGGQSRSGSEHLEFSAPGPVLIGGGLTYTCSPCSYYAVVRGWNGGESAYELRAALR